MDANRMQQVIELTTDDGPVYLARINIEYVRKVDGQVKLGMTSGQVFTTVALLEEVVAVIWGDLNEAYPWTAR